MTKKSPGGGSRRGFRTWAGPALLALAPLQFLAGDTILRVHHARPLNVLGALGFLLVVTSLLALVAGLGESGNAVAQLMARKD